MEIGSAKNLRRGPCEWERRAGGARLASALIFLPLYGQRLPSKTSCAAREPIAYRKLPEGCSWHSARVCARNSPIRRIRGCCSWRSRHWKTHRAMARRSAARFSSKLRGAFFSDNQNMLEPDSRRLRRGVEFARQRTLYRVRMDKECGCSRPGLRDRVTDWVEANP